MATLLELQARLEALKAQRDSAVARVSYDGRTVEYRGTAEIARAIAELEKELQVWGRVANDRVTHHVCAALGIPVEGIINGSELAGLTDEALSARLAGTGLRGQTTLVSPSARRPNSPSRPTCRKSTFPCEGR
jgi:hypothetical protein